MTERMGVGALETPPASSESRWLIAGSSTKVLLALLSRIRSVFFNLHRLSSIKDTWAERRRGLPGEPPGLAPRLDWRPRTRAGGSGRGRGTSSSSSVGGMGSLAAGQPGESLGPGATGTVRKGEVTPASSLSPSPACAPGDPGRENKLGGILQQIMRR